MELLGQMVGALGDRYRVDGEIGQGGMAVVFLAEDLKHHRRVAIKVLRPELSAALGGDRFLREIAIAATLQHPHILPLHDSGEAGGLLYYVMPFVEGESLRQRLARESPLPLELARQITRDVGSALQYAHDHGVVHRDIKPENIMLSGGHAVVADFGIARALDSADPESLTRTGMVLGTPHYMSPEQSGGAAVDGRSDQYSLACTLYEMLIGQPPFTGPSAHAVMARHSVDPVPSLRVVRQTVPPGVEGAIMQALAKLPADRFASVDRFLDALQTPGTTAVPAEAPTRGRRHLRRRLAAAVGATVLLATAGWWVVTHAGRGGAPPLTSVAVLPFLDSAAGPDSAYLAEGMTEGLIADLAGIGSLKVISGASGATAQAAGRSLAELARGLGVEAVVTGSLHRVGDSVRVTVRLFRARDSTALLSREYRNRLGTLPDLQREITVAISGALGARFAATERTRLDARQEVDQRAYEAYLRGRFNLEREELEPALAMFQQAIRIAPDWAPPYVGLAQYYTSLPFYTDIPPARVLPQARTALVQALALDDGLPEAHAAIAYIRAYYEWDWRAAEQEFRRALELRPSYADAYFSYGRFLASRRRLDEARAQLGRAVELDPLSPSLQANRALLDYFAGRYAEADSGLRTILANDSTDVTARWGLALVDEQQGRLTEAIAILEPISRVSLNRKATLGHVYAVSGDLPRARSILVALRVQAARGYVPSYYFALLYVGLGQHDEALRALEQAYDERSTVLAYLLIDPRLAPLREEPRFIALAQQLEGRQTTP